MTAVGSEKDAGAHLSSSSSSTSPPGSGDLTEEKQRSLSLTSNTSEESGPLSPLEHSLTTDIRTEAEQEAARAELVLTQTRTSIGSTASRPPDYEVVFDADDPENPRNWYVVLLRRLIAVSDRLMPHADTCCQVVTVPIMDAFLRVILHMGCGAVQHRLYRGNARQ
jgi:hypothetical protein